MLRFLIERPVDAPIKLLCLGAHCDDIELGCGGTILKWLNEHESVDIHWIVFSAAGERLREAEQSANQFLSAAASKRIEFHAFPDGYFPSAYSAIKDKFEHIKTRAHPDLILTHHLEDRHQDHKLLADLTWNTFRNHLILEYEIPKYEGDLGKPNLFVQLDKATCLSKARLIYENFPSQRARDWFDEETILSLARIRGIESKSPSQFAEAFHCRKLVIG